MLSAMLMLGSCSEDEMANSTGTRLGVESDVICFGIAGMHGPAQTRAASKSNAPGTVTGNFVLRDARTADTLYVKMTVGDFGPLPHFTGNAPMTRAACVDKETMHDSFGVTACIYSGPEKNYYFFNEKNTKPDNYDVGAAGVWVYDSGAVYYWPGDGHSLRFYAYAPFSFDGLVPPADTSPGEAPTLRYTVPQDAAMQTDLIACATDEMAGSSNTSVPLSFDHICTAVEFVAGGDMQPGTIKSIAIKGAYGTGEYSFGTVADGTASAWLLDTGSTADFVHDINKEVGTPHSDITSGTDCFILLPQTLPEGATVEVTFQKANGETAILTTPIAGHVWQQGARVRYTLSITPDHGLEFDTKPGDQDAHYVIYPITVKIGDEFQNGWELSSNDPANVTFVESGKFVGGDKIQKLVEAGYWLDMDYDGVVYHGRPTLGSTSVGEVKVFVFLTENATRQNREITLTLSPAAGNDGDSKTFTFTQYCPAWNGDIGVERIQDQDYPWGFGWGADITVTYKVSQKAWGEYSQAYTFLFGDQRNYITIEKQTDNYNYIIFEFGKIRKLTVGDDAGTGRENTWAIYNYDEVKDIPIIMEHLLYRGEFVSGPTTHPEKFAVNACAMKNKFNVLKHTHGNHVDYKPVLDNANLVWYLPARDEAPQMQDNLSGDYWTSTAILSYPNTSAYKYTAGGPSSPEDRNTPLHVRAIRRR